VEDSATPLPPPLQTLAADPLIGSFEAKTPLALPTRQLTAVTTLDDAVGKASHSFFGGEGLIVAHARSVVYVETSVGEARSLFQRSGERKAPDVGDGVPAWVFVARGEFAVQRPIGAYVNVTPNPTPSTFETVAVVIPKDGQRALVFYSGQPYDPSQLGTPTEIASSKLVELCDARVGQSSRARAQFC
jgi:hypothetical protein